jgi:hypothetical protein
MAYIGVQPTDTYLSIASQQITGNGGANYTLDYSVSDEESLAVFVNNVRQNVSSYTVSGTSLTLGGTISASDECWILFLGRTVGTKTPAVGSVTDSMMSYPLTNFSSTDIDVTGKGTFSGAGSFEALELITSDTNRVYVTGNSSVSGDMWRIGTSASNPYLNIDGLQASSGILFRTGGSNERMRIDSSGQVGIGTSNPQQLLHLKSLNPGGKIRLEMGQTAVANTDVTGEIQFYHNDASGAGVNADIKGICTNSVGAGALTFGTGTTSTTERMRINTSGVIITGSLSKSSGSFKIDHPLPKKTDTHHLVHSFVEAPQADNIYRGKVDLVNGTATVNIDTVVGMSEGTFILLNREIQCFTSNETGWTAVKGSVSENILTITAQDETCTDTISWLVIGERQDQHMYDTEWTDENGKVIVEPLKPVEEETLENA